MGKIYDALSKADQVHIRAPNEIKVFENKEIKSVGKIYEALVKAAQDHIRTPDEIKIFEIRVPSRPGICATTREQPAFVEEYHRMKQTIVSLDPDRKIKTLLFCCSIAGEGNSTVLLNFARTMASEGDNVLVIDANLRTPSIHEAFNLEQKNGFSDLILGRVTLTEVIKKTPFHNLSVITCGTRSASPFSLLESNRLPLLIEQIKPFADWILFDSPPVITYNDARTLATRIDGVIMVIEAEKTRWEVVNNARQRMENGSGKILGAVLNKRQMHIPEWAYNIL